MKAYIVSTCDYPEQWGNHGIALTPEAALRDLQIATEKDADNYPSCARYIFWELKAAHPDVGPDHYRITGTQADSKGSDDWDLTPYEVAE